MPVEYRRFQEGRKLHLALFARVSHRGCWNYADVRARIVHYTPMKLLPAVLLLALLPACGSTSTSSADSGAPAASGSAPLLISREEMVESTIQTAAAQAPMPADSFALVVRAPSPMLVLDAHPKDDWGKGDPRIVKRDDPATTRRGVDAAKLPAALTAWNGRRVELFGKASRACEVEVTGFALIGRVTPHFGTVARWNGTGDFQGEPRMPDREVADDAWGLSGGGGSASGEGGRILVAELKSASGDCASALWGRPAGGAPVKLTEAVPADPKTRDLALAELRKLPAYAALQKDYEPQKGPNGTARWEDFDGAKPDVRVMAHAAGVTLVTVSATAGRGCGDFGGALSAAWEMRGSTLTLVKDADSEALAPMSAGDVDGDGRIELIFQEAVLRSSGARYDHWDRLVVPFLDCGC